MPNPQPITNWEDERVIFENWANDGTHIFVDDKYVLTLATPESSKCKEACRAYIEDWVSPDDYCKHLAAVLHALGASPAMIEGVEQERENYRLIPVEPPTQTNERLLRQVTAMSD